MLFLGLILAISLNWGYAQNSSCGVRAKNFTSLMGNNIYGGCYAQLGEFPWEGIFEISNINNDGSLSPNRTCALTLISTQYALTSGRCIELATASGIHSTVRFGMTNYSDPTIFNNTIANWTIHPGYNLGDLYGNIAVIQLGTPVNITDNIKPICLPSSDFELVIRRPNTVAGWGYYSLDSQLCGTNNQGLTLQNSQLLVKADVPVMEHHLCSLYYPELNGTTLNNSTLCAGTDYSGAGNGSDWGTPLMTANYQGVWYQTGLLSAYFYDNNSMLLAQRLYTRIAAYCDFIKSATGGAVQCSEPGPLPTSAPQAKGAGSVVASGLLISTILLFVHKFL